MWNGWRFSKLLTVLVWLLAVIGSSANKKKNSQDAKHDPLAGKAIVSFKPGGQYALLTFSGGPHAIYTPQLLDILKKNDVKATFFVEGRTALLHPAIINRMVQEGHDIGQQGYLHKHTRVAPNIGTDFFPAPAATTSSSSSSVPIPLQRLSIGINETTAILHRLTKKKVTLYRPPSMYHSFLHHVVPYLHTNHPELQIVLSSLDSQDLLVDVALPGASVHFVDNLLQKITPGDIVLMHDSQRVTLQSLDLFLQKAFAAGYEFLTMSRILTFPDDSPK